MKKIIAAVIILSALLVLAAALLTNETRTAMGRRTEGFCPPFCGLIAPGPISNGPEFCPPFCEKLIAARNQALLEADVARFPREPAHLGGRTE